MNIRTLQAAKFLLVIASACALLGGAFFILRRSPPTPSERLRWAAGLGNLEQFKTLESNGADLNSQDPLDRNWTPLMIAIFHQQRDVIKYLLTRGVNLNVQDRDGETALMFAVSGRDTNTVWQLLNRGADASLKDRDGLDALALSHPLIGANSYNAIIFEWLRQYKSGVWPPTNDGTKVQ